MRVDLRSPQDGTVHQMTVHTVGGLVTPSEPAMLIVPTTEQLAVEVRIPPQDIDSVRHDQSAFNSRTTPEIDGTVSRVSTDPKTGQSYYTARILVPEDQRARLGAVRLVPGMPVEPSSRSANAPCPAS